MDNPNNLFVLALISAIVSVGGAFTTAVIALFKVKPEAKKLASESDSAMSEAAESIASGAKISNELLLSRIAEVEERETIRIAEMEKRETNRELELSELRYRVGVVESNLLKWKDYAYRLIHQVKSLGHEPVPFEAVSVDGKK